MRQKALRLTIRKLTGAATLRLVSGCRSAGGGCPDCPECIWSCNSADVDAVREFPLGGSPDVRMEVAFRGRSHRRALPVPTERDAEEDAFALEAAVVYTASAASVGVLAGASLALLPCCTWIGWRHGRRKAAAPLPLRKWQAHPWLMHPRWAHAWVQPGLVVGGYLMAVGVLWLLLLRAMAHPDASPSGASVAGLALSGAGGAVCVAVGLRALREDVAHVCPACGAAASRWRFRGVRLAPLPSDGAAAPRKGHRGCMRCVRCQAPVVVDQWLEGPPERPYHRKCWELLRREVCRSPAKVRELRVTDAELAHLLAWAIRTDSHASLAEFQALRPDLQGYALPGVPSARHYAARLGNHRALCALLRGHRGLLDARPDPLPPPAYSLRVTGLRAAGLPGLDDVYVCQTPLRHNQRPVYVGHTAGRYLYYYVPPDPESDTPPPGWCLSEHLGSGAPRFRLLLSDAPESVGAAAAAPEAAPPGPSPWLRWWRAGRRWGSKALAWAGAHATPGNALARLRPLAMLEVPGDPAQLHDDASAPHEIQNSPLQPHGPTLPNDDHGGTGDVPPPECDPEADSPARPYRMLSEAELGLGRVPHGHSLMEAAVSSGSEAVVSRTIEAYRAAVPQCLRWRSCRGDRLWTCEALPTRCDGGVRAACGSCAGAGPHFRSAFHYCSGGVWQATSSLDEVPTRSWGGQGVCHDVFVVLVSGAITAAALDRETLEMLCRERVVDPTLWSPAGWASQDLSETHVPAAGLRDVLYAALLGPDCPALQRLPSAAGPGRPQSRRDHRFSDGLDDPRASGGVHYAAEYRPPVGALQFCAALPDAKPEFDAGAVREMCVDALVKVAELQRQRVALSAVFVVPIYVYTYELAAGEQIYGAMNRAMRLHDEEAIAFWRPLIYHLDKALLELPTYTGRLYRGISVRFDKESYDTGQRLCWSAFSSASITRAVATEFIKAGAGTLFLLQSSSARAISRFSRFRRRTKWCSARTPSSRSCRRCTGIPPSGGSSLVMATPTPGSPRSTPLTWRRCPGSHPRVRVLVRRARTSDRQQVADWIPSASCSSYPRSCTNPYFNASSTLGSLAPWK